MELSSNATLNDWWGQSDSKLHLVCNHCHDHLTGYAGAEYQNQCRCGAITIQGFQAWVRSPNQPVMKPNKSYYWSDISEALRKEVDSVKDTVKYPDHLYLCGCRRNQEGSVWGEKADLIWLCPYHQGWYDATQES